MNIDEIKRSLNNRTNLEPSRDDIFMTKEKENPLPRPVRGDKVIKVEERKLVNDNYGNESSDEEEAKPQSLAWETTEEFLDISQPVSKIIDDLELEKNAYDWRYSTSKGMRSRKNFSNFLKATL